MNKLVLAVAACAAFATAASADPMAAQMSADALRNDMIVSTHADPSGSALAVLMVLAMIVFVLGMASGGSGYYYTVSDERLKTDIQQVGMKNGLPIYQFRYIGVEQHLFEGVMAQDVQKVYPDAVMEADNGYLAVNYDAIGIDVRLIE